MTRKAVPTNPSEQTERMKKLMKESCQAFEKPEQADLIPELQEYIAATSFGQALRHPLVSFPVYDPKYNHAYNCQLQAKRLQIELAIDKKDWHSVLFSHERPWRLQVFEQYMTAFTDEEFWRLLADVYIDSERLWENKNTWNNLLSSNRSGRQHFMTEEERCYLESLTEPIKVLRGCNRAMNSRGFSWTVSPAIAEQFAAGCNDKSQAAVLERLVQKSAIFAYKNGRKEDEIVLFPSVAWE